MEGSWCSARHKKSAPVNIWSREHGRTQTSDALVKQSTSSTLPSSFPALPLCLVCPSAVQKGQWQRKALCMQSLVLHHSLCWRSLPPQDGFFRCPSDWPCVDDAFVKEHKGWCWRMESSILKILALITGRHDVYSCSVLFLPALLSCARMPANLEQLLLLRHQRSGLKCKREGLICKLPLMVWCKSTVILRTGSERVRRGGCCEGKSSESWKSRE